MKKLLVLLLIGVSCTIYNCLALNRFSMPLVEVSDMSDLISEEVNPVYDNGYIVGFDLNIVIPDNYDSDFININSSVIGASIEILISINTGLARSNSRTLLSLAEVPPVNCVMIKEDIIMPPIPIT